ncbi:hypothetical protein AMTR_s00090p00182470, partial [Amborella trichopoda]
MAVHWEISLVDGEANKLHLCFPLSNMLLFYVLCKGCQLVRVGVCSSSIVSAFPGASGDVPNKTARGCNINTG